MRHRRDQLRHVPPCRFPGGAATAAAGPQPGRDHSHQDCAGAHPRPLHGGHDLQRSDQSLLHRACLRYRDRRRRQASPQALERPHEMRGARTMTAASRLPRTTRNPYLVPRPAVISFSGSRTSPYMLRKIVDAYSGHPARAPSPTPSTVTAPTSRQSIRPRRHGPERPSPAASVRESRASERAPAVFSIDARSHAAARPPSTRRLRAAHLRRSR